MAALATSTLRDLRRAALMPSRWSDLDRPPLDTVGLNRALVVPAGLWREVRVVEQTGSTNADLAAAARGGEAEGVVLVAEHQTAAKGRLGRSWTAPARAGLSFSVLLRPIDVDIARWSLLPLLTGVATAVATASVSDVDIGLKWPNDLMIGERKLAGILAERVDSAVVIGVGLNVSLKTEELPVESATSLTLANATVSDRDIILRAVLRAIEGEYTSWRLDGGDSRALLARYRGLCVTLGRSVRAELPGDQTIEGEAVDIDPNGSLVIETSAGRRTVSAGDVVHLR
jgi:BirA family transcriptional regulator, biotin operon repressor / biotin---[acetyl-CoA-carboxylase] ligase